MSDDEKKTVHKKEILVRLIPLAMVFLLCLLVSRFFCQIMLIQGPSMEPAYKSGQIVLLNKWDRQYEVGDVIAFHCENLHAVLVKRIAAMEERTETVFAPDAYYVLGDNPEQSIDSRSEQVGMVKKEDIIGKIWFPVK